MALAADSSIYVPEPVTLLETEQPTELEKVFRVKFDSGRPLGHGPGQFVQVSLFGIGEAPISICSCPGNDEYFEMTVRNVGMLTNKMHQMADGAKFGVRGPFGTTFPMDEMKGKDLVMVAGGIGLPPLRSLILPVMENRDEFGKVFILFGTRTPQEILFADDLKAWNEIPNTTVLQTVDQGDDTWDGNVGVVTTLFPQVSVDPDNTYAAIVGPPIMYKFVVMELAKLGVADERIFMSLERRMKCGVGKCGHCQINQVCVCMDGPVFRYSEARDMTEAI
ncbi:MAG: oxidoreductase [Armatimonadia bacterium]|nr:oxidoreductase [Armatimonadia bacterium]